MSNPVAYTFKLASRPLQKAVFAALLLFLATLPVMDIPMSDASFPAHITEAARITAIASLIVTMVAVLVFVFYRTRATVYVDDTGIQLPHHSFISWGSIQWYRVDMFSSNSGIRRVVLKAFDGNKTFILAEDGEALYNLTEEIKQRLRMHNPLAKDYRELKSSRRRAYVIIPIIVAIHVTVCILTGFDKKYIVIFTPALLISIGAVLLEHIKITHNQN